jgi:hypothetical protein
VPVTNKKGKKLMSSLTIEHVLRPPTPGYPEEKERRVILEENLKKMGCGKLWDLPWRYSDEQMLKEVVSQRSTTFPDSIREKPEKWTVSVLAKKWLLLTEGEIYLPGRRTWPSNTLWAPRVEEMGGSWPSATTRNSERCWSS